MPNYDFKCESCGVTEEFFAHINETTLSCICGGTMKRLFSPSVYIIPDISPYIDENLAGPDGKPVYVMSRQHKRQILKERGLEQKR